MEEELSGIGKGRGECWKVVHNTLIHGVWRMLIPKEH